jgi:hypothetical protein
LHGIVHFSFENPGKDIDGKANGKNLNKSNKERIKVDLKKERIKANKAACRWHLDASDPF